MRILESQSRRQPLLLFTGNSLTAVPVSDYVQQVAALLPSIYDIVNQGVNGQTTTTMNTQASTKVDSCYRATRLKNICTPWEITNDLYFGATKENAYTAYVNFCTARRNQGFQVVACTILPRSDVDTPVDFETSRTYCNSNIVSNWASFADALADIGANTTIGEAGDELNTTYYTADKVHLNSTGFGIVAGIVKDAILTL